MLVVGGVMREIKLASGGLGQRVPFERKAQCFDLREHMAGPGGSGGRGLERDEILVALQQAGGRGRARWRWTYTLVMVTLMPR